MSKYDSMVSSNAWDSLVESYTGLSDDEREDHFTVAELLRNAMFETEGV